MMCSACNKNPATVHYTDVVNGDVHTHKFCLDCAKKIGLFNQQMPVADMMKSFDNIMQSFDEVFKGINFDPAPKTADITCPDCGMTLSKFKQTGRFGCAKDYDLFKVGPALEKIHGASVHTGKVPETSPDNKIRHLKKDMEAAVKAEDYEKAAMLRDEIKKLEIAK